ncbi:MAG TPA: hypothetical protein PKE64_09845 [Anaerolineae bacterium]|nr:hypothetical protein [Anaerolineae bacterium]HMR64299.1 hypothetical protein [Anaerolineae bacterium]
MSGRSKRGGDEPEGIAKGAIISRPEPTGPALAMMVPSRLWLGGAISPKRDLSLIQALVEQVRAIALGRPLLVAVDSLASYVTAFQQSFRTPLPRHGQPGRCRLRAWSEPAIV